MINLSKEESTKRLGERKVNLQKVIQQRSGLDGQLSRVAVVMDYSGSMYRLYHGGEVQEVLERLLPIAMQFDDNGEMELWIFENGFRRLPNISMDNFYGYVDREILSHKYHMGGTCYAPVMKDVMKKYTQEDPADLPDFILFITDGANSDKAAAKAALTDASRMPIFWQFIGIGDGEFPFLEKLDEMEGRYVDNANFFPIRDIAKLSDDQLYDMLLGEFPCWLEYPEVKKMIGK